MSGYFMLGLVRLGQVKTVYVRLCQVGSGCQVARLLCV
jgi:hypothetical protein